ncbi:MAG TPA: twin-arginine translocation signal domain-containing protein [Candidatus Sulfotelmatobacter sp.]
MTIESKKSRRKFLEEAAAVGGIGALGTALPVFGQGQEEKTGSLKIVRVKVIKDQTTERQNGKDVELDFEAFAPDGTSDVIRSFTRYVYNGDLMNMFMHRSASKFGADFTLLCSGKKGDEMTTIFFDKAGNPHQLTQPWGSVEKLFPGVPNEERMNLYLQRKEK